MSALALRLEDFGLPAPVIAPAYTQADLDAAHRAGLAEGAAQARDHATEAFCVAVTDLCAEAAARAEMMQAAHAQALSDLARLADAVMQAALPELQSRLTARLVRRELERLAKSATPTACTVTGEAALLAQIAETLPEDARDLVRLEEGPATAIRLASGRLDIDAARFCAKISTVLSELIERNQSDECA